MTAAAYTYTLLHHLTCSCCLYPSFKAIHMRERKNIIIVIITSCSSYVGEREGGIYISFLAIKPACSPIQIPPYLPAYPYLCPYKRYFVMYIILSTVTWFLTHTPLYIPAYTSLSCLSACTYLPHTQGKRVRPWGCDLKDVVVFFHFTDLFPLFGLLWSCWTWLLFQGHTQVLGGRAIKMKIVTSKKCNIRCICFCGFK